jgi:septal ring factor EnvC (AmiA/AmiB activator)
MKPTYVYAALVAAILVIGLFAGVQLTTLEQTQSTLSSTQLQVQERDSTISSLTLQITALNQNISSLNQQASNFNLQLATLTAQRDSLQSQLAAAQAAAGNQTAIITSLSAQVNSLNQDIFAMKANLSDANAQVATLQSQLAAANSQVSSLQAQLASANSQVTLLQTQLANVTADRNLLYNITSLNMNQAIVVNRSIVQPAGYYTYYSMNVTVHGFLHVYLNSTSPDAVVEVKNNFTGFGNTYGIDLAAFLGTGSDFVYPVLPGPVIVEVHNGNNLDMTGNITIYYWY